jgi:eukaryotic-like serine/threonine-protein kinase
VTLQSGTRLGPYEVLAPVGAGGMGEVYKARDTRLDRTVAIKVLHVQFAADPQFRERFEREAKAISQLSHPHICTLHDVGRQDGIDYLVMEYLEGQTLAERLGKGALPLDQALQYAIQITDALDKAHHQGIVHRDLKPGNIMLTKSGAKLLDFGLAKLKAGAAPASLSALSALPTQDSPMTAQGTIIGTLQYMAPEQLEGKDVDARTDIFAFGSIIYEMATGKKAFEAITQASLIAAILDREPVPISRLQPLAPPLLDHLVQRCLAKDPDDRWQSAHDVLLQLRWIQEAGTAADTRLPPGRLSTRQWVAWGVSAVLFVGGAVATTAYLRQSQEPPALMRFSVLPPEQATFKPIDGPVTLSPDGRHMVFGASDAAGAVFLWVQSLDSTEARKLEGTQSSFDPFWSPDGRHIAFWARGKIWRIALSGGPPQIICDALDGRGGTWNRDDVIVFARDGAGPLYRVPAAGGTPEPVTALDRSRQEVGHWRPHFLPDGRRFLYLVRSRDSTHGGIYAGWLDGRTSERVAAIDAPATYAPSGFLLFVRERTLMAQAVDADRLRTTGDPFPVARDVEYVPHWGAAGFSISQTGILAYQAGSRAIRRLVWFDRSGKELGVLAGPGEWGTPHISPDGKQVAVTQTDPQTRNSGLWLIDIARGTTVRVTFGIHHEESPAWSPDASRIAFTSNREGSPQISQRPLIGGGSEELLVKPDLYAQPDDWSPDGRFLVYVTFGLDTDLWLLPLSGDRKPIPLATTPFNEQNARFSPDGRWVAYVSNESGRMEVYVQPVPPTGEKWQVSTSGGDSPRWARSNSELFYRSVPGHRLKVVEIRKAPPFEVGAQKDLFETPMSWGSDVTGDGQRWLVNLPVNDTPLSPITIVLNWTAGLGRN